MLKRFALVLLACFVISGCGSVEQKLAVEQEQVQSSEVQKPSEEVVPEEDTKPIEVETPTEEVQPEEIPTDSTGYYYSKYVDVVSMMYPSLQTIQERVLDNPKETRPFVLCEYTHAMGNSCGDHFEFNFPRVALTRFSRGF